MEKNAGKKCFFTSYPVDSDKWAGICYSVFKGKMLDFVREVPAMKMDKIGENQGITHRPKIKARTGSKEHSVKDTVDIGSSRHVPDRKQIMKALSAAEIGEVLSLSIDAMPLWDCKDPSLQSTKFPSLIASKDGALFARSGDGLLRLDGETGKVEWQSALSTPLVLQHDSTWQGKDGKLLVFCQDQTIRSLDPATGKEEWSFPLGADFKSPLSVEDDGTMLVFRKKGDNLHLTRLRPDGSIVKSTKLGLWDDPIGGNPVHGHFLSTEPDGDRIIKATTREAPQPNGYRPTHFSTIRVGADGTVKWSKDHTVEPPVFFPGDPDHFYTLEFGSMQRLSRATGESLWILKNKPEHEGGITGQGYGDMLFELGGEKKYKYLKLVDATPDRLILQGYCEGPLRSTKSGEEILCVDAANPEKVL
jgi:outer membrane protein assembly factor BamB